MKTWQKMIMGIVIGVFIGAVVYFGVSKNKDKGIILVDNLTNTTTNTDQIFNEYVNETSKNEGSVNSENFSDSKETSNSEKQENEEEAEREEEQEPFKAVEVKGSDEEKAIALAKNKWGANGDVSFEIANHENSVYYISVNDNKTTEVLAWYKVNVENGEVSDY